MKREKKDVPSLSGAKDCNPGACGVFGAEDWHPYVRGIRSQGINTRACGVFGDKRNLQERRGSLRAKHKTQGSVLDRV